MASIQLGPVGEGVQTAPPAAPVAAYTGSSSEYWAIAAAAAAQQAEYERAVEQQKRQQKLRRKQRIFTILYNVLSVAELVYFIVGLALVQWQVADLEDNPLLGPGVEGFNKMGATNTQRIIQRRQYWRLLSSMFYNAGAIHLAGNLGMVWAFGHLLVRDMAVYTVVFIFLASGLAGVIFSANIGAEYTTAAASIPPFGLAGAATAMLILRWRHYTCYAWTAAMVCLVLGTNVFIGATPFVDNSGNTAGFVFGAVLCVGVLLIRRQPADSKGGEVLMYGAAAVAVLAVLAAGIGGLVGLQLEAPAGGCCNEWVCVTSPWWDCDASRIWPNTCTYTTFFNGTAVLTCPLGQSITIGTINRTDIGAAQVEQWCASYCAVDLSGLPGAGSRSSYGGGGGASSSVGSVSRRMLSGLFG